MIDYTFDTHLTFKIDSRGADQIAVIVRFLHRRRRLCPEHGY